MPWLPRKTVIVPVDFSDNCPEAVKTALELAGGPAGVHLVHVLLPLDYMSPGAILGSVTDDSREKSTRKFFDQYLAKYGFTQVQSVIRFGDPGLEITDYAREQQADLIVISSHGYHGVKRLVLGSVAERVIRHADCPVLVLRRSDAD